MSVDPYSECPCGRGKKIKFCCPDLFADLDKAHRMIDGDQPRAALQHLEKTLKKHPGRGALLDLKATLELSLEEHAAAKQTVEEYVRVDPQNPTAHAQGALIECADRKGREAVEHLQNAFALVAEQIPSRVLQAVGAVGQALLVEGDMIAARAHLWLYQGIAGQRDSSAMELLLKLNQVSGLPLLLRDNLYMHELPPGHEAEQPHDYAQMLASRGQWARAAAELELLCQKYPDLPVLIYNHALVRGWLGETERFVEGMRQFAQLGTDGTIDWDDAVEAEAIAQLLSEELREPPLEVVKTTLAVKDEDGFIDRFTRDPRAETHTLSPEELAAQGGPPPRCSFLLLDRSMPESGVELTDENLPHVCGILSYFGKQTDREQRLEFIADRSQRFDDALALVHEIGGDTLGEVITEEVIGKSASESVFDVRWRFPAEATMAVRRELLTAQRRTALLEVWPKKPLAALAGKSPQEAANQADLRVALAAVVLNLEQELSRGLEPQDLVELRSRLGLPAPTAIDPEMVDLVMLPLVRLGRVDLQKASDEELGALFERCELSGAQDAQLQVAREAISRPEVEDKLPREMLYQRLVSYEPDPQRALDWVEHARGHAEQAGQSSAPWDIAELELRVVHGEIEEANRLVQHIRAEHLSEPGVAEQLYRMLYSLGAIQPGQTPAPQAAPVAAAPDEPAAASKLWTPDNDPGQSAGEKKIWTPT